ncbi:hypothetical protein ACFVHW_38720 [Streptomyces sp. NPDC127110]|uniref:hypothetical protein n=1 Tax=Streptomyces sp. NPDC127110 TaxID=3345362 RepID=UPI00362C03ED
MYPIPARPAATPCPTDVDDDTGSLRAAGAIEPSVELLTRAQAGWERFLTTFTAATDE